MFHPVCKMDTPIKAIQDRRQETEPETLIEAQIPSTIDTVANDYKELTDLKRKLDEHIDTFIGHMGQIQSNMSKFEGLRILWDEQVKTVNHETKEFRLDEDSNR